MSDNTSLVNAGSEPIRVRLGDISVTDTRVHTPLGSYPLRGTSWTVANQTVLTESIPGYAIVLAIIFFIFCLLGLLFLLIKERTLHGTMLVTVYGPGLTYSAYVPVYNERAVYEINSQVNWIQARVAQLSV